MPEKITKLVRQFIINAETEEALKSLLRFLEARNDSDRCNEVMLLYSNFNTFRKKSRQGLGDYDVEKNQINHALLAICTELDHVLTDEPAEDEPSTAIEQSDLDRKMEALEAQLRLMHRMLERLTDDGMERFQHSRIWQYLDEKTRDYMLAAVAMERDEYLEDYATVVLEFCNALENELREKFFIPYREAFRKKHSEISKELFYDHAVSMVKNQLYRYLMKPETDLTLNQMIRILFDNLAQKEETRQAPFLTVIDFLHQRFKLKNLDRLMDVFSEMSDIKYDRTARVFIYNKAESDHVKTNVLDVFSCLQPKKRT